MNSGVGIQIDTCAYFFLLANCKCFPAQKMGDMDVSSDTPFSFDFTVILVI